MQKRWVCCRIIQRCTCHMHMCMCMCMCMCICMCGVRVCMPAYASVALAPLQYPPTLPYCPCLLTTCTCACVCMRITRASGGAGAGERHRLWSVGHHE